MKKHILLAVILTLIFSSCSTEKEEPVPPVPPVTQSLYPKESVFGPSGPTKVVDVTNPITGRTWMDRNLGATRAATSSTDVESFGDLYQWGRGADGHQIRTSATTSTLSSKDVPGNGNFIFALNPPRDWRTPSNNFLWQSNISVGVVGINNPCPSGYRIPTIDEWKDELSSWSTRNTEGAFNGPLKLPMAGHRPNYDAGIETRGAIYWSSGNNPNSLSITGGTNGAIFFGYGRAFGCCVRCIKN